MSSATIRHIVGAADTAAVLGSGDLDVLGTPRLLAWCEAATCAALALDAGQTSVGIRVTLDHRAPSTVGAEVVVTAELVTAEGRNRRFAVRAEDGEGTLMAEGEVVRAVVDRERFVDRLRPMPD